MSEELNGTTLTTTPKVEKKFKLNSEVVQTGIFVAVIFLCGLFIGLGIGVKNYSDESQLRKDVELLKAGSLPVLTIKNQDGTTSEVSAIQAALNGVDTLGKHVGEINKVLGR